MLLAFPFLHPELAPKAPAAVHFTDPRPGALEAEAGERFHRPAGLPLTEADAAGLGPWLEELSASVRTPAEMAGLAAQAAKVLTAPNAAPSVKSITAELMGEAAPEDGSQAERLRQAHLTLLLAWQREERLLELAELDGDVRAAQSSFRQGLGLEAAELAEVAELGLAPEALEESAPEAADVTELALAWPGLVEALARLGVLSEAALYVDHPAVLADFAENGVDFAGCAPEQAQVWGLALDEFSGLEVAKAPLGQLLGRRGSHLPDDLAAMIITLARPGSL